MFRDLQRLALRILILMRNRTSLPTDDHGAAMVEFAIVASIFFMLVFAIVEFGRGYNAKIELTGAVREGARSLALGQSVGTAETVVQNAAPNLAAGVTFPSTPVGCSAGSAGNATITAAYSLPYNIPLVSSGTWQIQVTGVMRCGA